MPRKGAQAAWRRIGTGLAGDAAGAKRVLRGGKGWRDSCPDKEARDAAASNSEEDRSRRARRRRIPERVEGRMEEKWIAALREGRRRMFRGETGRQGARCRKGRECSQERWRGKEGQRCWEDGVGERSRLGFLRPRWERRAR